MSQDLEYIRNQLKNCEEVDSAYDIKIGQHVKYITINDGDEYFYDGGKYSKMGDNKIILKNGSKIIYVPLLHQNKDGYIFHRTRLFVVDENKQSGGATKNNNNINEYEKIIKAQQMIIEKLNLQIKRQAEIIDKLEKKI
jgi:hypothetical protein